VSTIQALSQTLEDSAMNTLMMTLQQPISVAALAHCLGWGPAQARAATARRRPPRPCSRLAAARAKELDRAKGEDGEDGENRDDIAKGCGWFESSRDLHQGLVVLEHNGVENLGAELPITVWLGLVLDGAAAAAATAPPVALAVRA
jgi:hypothetical protein